MRAVLPALFAVSAVLFSEARAGAQREHTLFGLRVPDPPGYYEVTPLGAIPLRGRPAGGNYFASVEDAARAHRGEIIFASTGVWIETHLTVRRSHYHEVDVRQDEILGYALRKYVWRGERNPVNSAFVDAAGDVFAAIRCEGELIDDARQARSHIAHTLPYHSIQREITGQAIIEQVIEHWTASKPSASSFLESHNVGYASLLEAAKRGTCNVRPFQPGHDQGLPHSTPPYRGKVTVYFIAESGKTDLLLSLHAQHWAKSQDDVDLDSMVNALLSWAKSINELNQRE